MGNMMKRGAIITIPMTVMFSLLLWRIFTKVLQPRLNAFEGKPPESLLSPDLMLISAILESYILISLITCLMSHTFRPLNSWRDRGFVFYSVLGFGIGLILSMTMSMVVGPNLGVLVGLLIGLLFGLIAGLKEEWRDQKLESY
jgi:hypothetical protein